MCVRPAVNQQERPPRNLQRLNPNAVLLLHGLDRSNGLRGLQLTSIVMPLESRLVVTKFKDFGSRRGCAALRGSAA
jgi:hypothetical protein